MKLTAAKVEQKVSEYKETIDFVEEYGYSNLYDYIKSESGWSSENLEVPGLGKLEYVEDYGGEGQGDDYWVVFKIGEQYFRKDGWYASYDGGELDGELYEVFPRQVTITEYVVKKDEK